MKYIDMHCDTIPRLYELGKAGIQENLRENKGHLDLIRMRAGDCLAQSFALYTNLKSAADPYEYCMALCDRFKEELNKNADIAAQAVTVEQILDNDKKGLLSAVLTVEEGAVCKGDTGLLRTLYDAGARMMTLTWNYENELAYPNRIDELAGNHRPETERGLKEKGIEFVELMEELGMVVDVSHLGDAGFWDVVRVSKKPFAASHSNARAVAASVRNMTDEMIRALAGRGGVMGINFARVFLSDRDENGIYIPAAIRHIRHIRNVGGIECIGLGSDHDGATFGKDMDSPAAFERLYTALRKDGFTEDEVEKIFYKNALRLYKDVWKC